MESGTTFFGTAELVYFTLIMHGSLTNLLTNKSWKCTNVRKVEILISDQPRTNFFLNLKGAVTWPLTGMNEPLINAGIVMGLRAGASGLTGDLFSRLWPTRRSL